MENDPIFILEYHPKKGLFHYLEEMKEVYKKFSKQYEEK